MAAERQMAKKVATAEKFDVSIEKVLEKMKAIIDAGREHEFLADCASLEDEKFVVVDAKLVKVVKKFIKKHELKHDFLETMSVAARGADTPTAPTCFEHKA
jgi:hypothetical protein